MPRWNQSVYSEMVESVGYDPDTGELFVTFISGSEYVYEGVPEEVALNLANAASVGGMMNSDIKGRYPYRRIG